MDGNDAEGFLKSQESIRLFARETTRNSLMLD